MDYICIKRPTNQSVYWPIYEAFKTFDSTGFPEIFILHFEQYMGVPSNPCRVYGLSAVRATCVNQSRLWIDRLVEEMLIEKLPKHEIGI